MPEVFISELDRIIGVSITMPKEIETKTILRTHLINILTLMIENDPIQIFFDYIFASQ
jgi:hypothetical protein